MSSNNLPCHGSCLNTTIQCVKTLVNNIIEDSFTHFITGCPGFLLDPAQRAGQAPMSYAQFTALHAFVLTRDNRKSAINYIMGRLGRATRRLLVRIHQGRIYLVPKQRTDLVLCLLVGFLSHHIEDRDSGLFTVLVNPSNVLAAQFVKSVAPQEGLLHPAMVSRTSSNGLAYDYSHLIWFSHMMMETIPSAVP